MINQNSEKIVPIFGKNSVNLALSSSNYFVPYLAACIASIVKSSNKTDNYDILILEHNISEFNKVRLLSLVKQHANISIRFINVDKHIKNINFYINGNRINMETYFGLLLPWILPSFDKIITMDCDMIVKNDIAKLFHINIENYLGAGVKDIILQGFLNEKNPKWRKYYQQIKISNPENCINGGLILLNLEAFRKVYSINDIVDLLTKRQFRVVDQDIFNILLQNKVKFLDLSWNHLICPDPFIQKTISNSPSETQKSYFKSQSDPYIIHFAGDVKPWDRPEIQFADDFWQALRGTVFYEETIARMARKDASDLAFSLIASGDLVYYMPFDKIIVKSIKKIIDRTITPLFPKESKQRSWLSSNYRKLLKTLRIK